MPLTEALVNVEATIRRLAARGLIDPARRAGAGGERARAVLQAPHVSGCGRARRRAGGADRAARRQSRRSEAGGRAGVGRADAGAQRRPRGEAGLGAGAADRLAPAIRTAGRSAPRVNAAGLPRQCAAASDATRSCDRAIGAARARRHQGNGSTVLRSPSLKASVDECATRRRPTALSPRARSSAKRA